MGFKLNVHSVPVLTDLKGKGLFQGIPDFLPMKLPALTFPMT